MNEFEFETAEGSIVDAMDDDGRTQSTMRFGFVSGADERDPLPNQHPELATLLARGSLGLDPRITHHNVERHRSTCPICNAPFVVFADGKTKPLLTDADEEGVQALRLSPDAPRFTIPPAGELWFRVNGTSLAVAPTFVTHLVDYHGYVPPPHLLAALLKLTGKTGPSG